MNNLEKEILKIMIERGSGLYSPSDLINGIAHHDRNSVERLVVEKYIEEVPQDHTNMTGNTYNVPFYRVTEKGLIFFSPWYKKFWFWFNGDVRTILVSLITAVLTILLTNIIK